jgi:tRNA threonylcarbamoyl adenosine modification protein (Sua5/YciO/YrdC/YwlC family)
MTHVLDWRNGADARDLIHAAVQALAEGHLVAFPTDTVYVVAASALVPEAVERLQQTTQRAEDNPLPLAVAGSAEALDWAPDMSLLGRRLARRCWPGPVTLVSAEGVERGLASRLLEPVRRRVCPTGALGLIAPGHEAFLAALRELPGPVVLAGAGKSGQPAAVTAGQVVEALGETVGLVVDDGPARYGREASVVRVAGNRWEMLREGAVPADLLERQTACLIVFVCTGNTCRSPLAEALCKKRLADRLGCAVAELPRRGFLVLSAGLAAMMGGAAAEEAVAVADTHGADLRSHRSRPLTPDLVAQADYLVVMTQGHLQALAAQFRRLRPRARLLSAAGDDVPDPIGGEHDVYQECAQRIWRHLEEFVGQLPGECFSAGAGAPPAG